MFSYSIQTLIITWLKDFTVLKKYQKKLVPPNFLNVNKKQFSLIFITKKTQFQNTINGELVKYGYKLHSIDCQTKDEDHNYDGSEIFGM